MPVFEIPNSLRHGKLAHTVALVVEECKAGNPVTIVNEGSFAPAAVQVVEEAKNELQKQNIKVFQSNKLDHTPEYAPENPEEPLAKARIHHYNIKFTVTLSTKPIEPNESGAKETQQISS